MFSLQHHEQQSYERNAGEQIQVQFSRVHDTGIQYTNTENSQEGFNLVPASFLGNVYKRG